MVKTSPIRVLHVLWTSQIGGITMGVRDLANAADPGRWEIQVCVLADGDFDLAPSLRRPTRVETLHLSSGRDLAGVARFCRLLRNTPCDLVHSHTPSPAAALAITTCLPRTPRIFHEHGAVLGRRGSWRARAAYACVARSYHRFVVVSAPLAEAMTDAGAAQSRVRVVENGIDIGLAEAAPSRADSRRLLGLHPDGLIVGTACRLTPEKDLGLFLNVARCVRAVRDDVRFVIVGGGPMAAELKRAASGSGLGDAVVFLGPRTDMPVVWRAMDLFLFTSLAEGFGRTLLESQASKIPVVAPREVGGGAAGLIESSPGILATGSRDPDALAPAVLHLLASADERDDLGRLGREWVARRFGAERWVAELQAVYEELGPQPGRR